MSSCLQGWLKAEPTMTLDFTVNPIGSHWTPMSFIKTGTERFSNIYDFFFFYRWTKQHSLLQSINNHI